jgi:putative ATPase
MLSPLAEQLRPQTIEQIVGQDHLLSQDGFILNSIQSHKPLSMILWGPPGCGKTSLARLYAKAFSIRFESLSAIFSGVADLKKIVKEIDDTPLFSKGILLFVDEIHRFNKAQQDAFLPFLENGKIVLIGATAENPSFYLNDALLSRVRVLKLEPLSEHALAQLIQHYEKNKAPLHLTEESRHYLIQLAQGDGRYLFNLIETLQTLAPKIPLDIQGLQKTLQKRAPLFDKSGDQHYNLISALHKSVRGSDPDAALYWFARMLEGGEEPLFLARRLIRMASEDVGLADPQALSIAIAAKDAYEMLGSPEGELALAEAVVYMALAPKSNAIYTAFGKARETAVRTSHLDPPKIILNAPTRLMKEHGYGKGYIYDHETSQGFSGQNYFPDGMERPEFYMPYNRGFEREMNKRLEYFSKLRKGEKSY